jgi:predicted phage baseplate assembly protein
VTIYGNVVKATHGESRHEVLGSGDAAKALQEFVLKQPPLTYVSAPTPAGVESTLKVRINDVEWHEVDSLAGLKPNERRFISRTNDDSKTSVVFGNGEAGARLPTGQENIRATYRNGIGKPGNVKAEQISLLSTRPLGVKGVLNPIRASGGADKESRDQARKNAPLAVTALDRLVSVLDHADFARTFGGVGKASAIARSDGRREVVYLTIAGVDDIPIDENADLFRNLRAALHRYGDPMLPIRLQVRERLALVVAARVRLLPDYLWEAIEPRIRQTVLDAFSFDNLELGQDLLASTAVTVIQSVRGVAYVDLDVFDAISEQSLLAGFETGQAAPPGLQDRITVSMGGGVEAGALRRAQIAYLTPDVPDTLILQEIKA